MKTTTNMPFEIGTEAQFKRIWWPLLAACDLDKKNFLPLLFKKRTQKQGSWATTYDRWANQVEGGPVKKVQHRTNLLQALYNTAQFLLAFPPGKPLTVVEFTQDVAFVKQNRVSEHWRREHAASLEKQQKQSVDYSYGIPRESLEGYFVALTAAHTDACAQRNAFLPAQFSAALVYGYEIVGQWQDAARNCKHWVREAEKLGDWQGQTEAFFHWGLACYRSGDFSDALQHFEGALRLMAVKRAALVMRLSAEAEDYRAMALFRQDSSKAPNAKNALVKNEANWKNLGIPLLHASWKHRMGIIEMSLGNFESSTKLTLDSLECRMNHGAVNFQSRSLMQLSSIHRAKGELRQARHIAMLAHCFHWPMRDHAGLADYYYHMGLLHCLLTPENVRQSGQPPVHDNSRLRCDFASKTDYPDPHEQRLLMELTEVWFEKIREDQFTLGNALETSKYFFKKSMEHASEHGLEALSRRAQEELKRLSEMKEQKEGIMR